MDSTTRELQRQLDDKLLHFVRGMQNLAPVTDDSAAAFAHNTARLRVTIDQVRDRLAYLVSAECLDVKREWQDGTWLNLYKITALGRDILDGVRAPLNSEGN